MMGVLLFAVCLAFATVKGEDQTYAGNGDNKPCVFPFIYNGVSINQCIDDDHDRPWCSTTSDFDTDGLWGNCLYPKAKTGWQPLKGTYGGNGGNKSCVLPFTYSKIQFNDCITDGHDLPWCAVTSDYDVDGLWGNCRYPQTSNIVTIGGNSNGATCFFPFIYNGLMYEECTADDHHSLWCATTPDYDHHYLWGSCPAVLPTAPVPGGF